LKTLKKLDANSLELPVEGIENSAKPKEKAGAALTPCERIVEFRRNLTPSGSAQGVTPNLGQSLT
jgi:hypothetical protein